MGVRLERDPDFWIEVASHPEVGPRIGVTAAQIVQLCANPRVVPLASEHGGFFFVALDAFGTVQELHSLFTPEGWGREVVEAAHAAFKVAMNYAHVIVTWEQEGQWRTRPPKSHGWKPAGDFDATPLGSLRMWVLTREAWSNSPAVRRQQTCH